MSNANRLHILQLLISGEMTVGHIAETVELSNSSTSQHLAVLRAEDIVVARRESQIKYYSLKSPAVRALLVTLSNIFEPQLNTREIDPFNGLQASHVNDETFCPTAIQS